jgi:hypothetical protein
LSFLEIRAERRQKSISVELSFAVVSAFKHHVSAACVIVLFISNYCTADEISQRAIETRVTFNCK